MSRLSRGIGSLLALLVGLEIGTRLDELVRWGTPLGSTAASINDIITVDSAGARGIPGAQYRQFTFNSAGLRGPELDASRPRILVLGASETFGLYEPAGKEYPRQLQDSLAARGCMVDVVNAALPGFSLPTLEATFRRRLRPLRATIAVLYPTPVQYLEVDRPAFRPPTATAAPARSPLAQLRFVRRLRDHLKTVLPARVKTILRQRETVQQQRALAGVAPWTTVPADRLQAYEADLASLLDTLAASGVRPLVATHANAFGRPTASDEERLVAWAKFYPRAAPALLPRFEREANAAAVRLLRARGVPVSDIATFMTQFPTDSVFADFSHFTAAGSAHVAGRLAADLMGTVGCPATTR